MSEKIKNMQENAKVDWMKIVKKHNKKQKGLPALSTLNTNAGNVELNNTIFNSMTSNSEATVDAVNGNITSGGSSEGCCMGEAVELDREDSVLIHYDDIPYEYELKPERIFFNTDQMHWDRDEAYTKTIEISWDYLAPKESVESALERIPEIKKQFLMSDYDDIYELIEQNFESYLKKYDKELKFYFFEDAVEDAEKNFDMTAYSYEEDDPYMYESAPNNTAPDDVFDMSTRTLL